MFKERLKRIPKTVYLCIHLHNVPYTVRTRKQWKRKTALEQKLIVFDVVTKQIVILVTKMGLFTLHHFYVSCSIGYVKSYLESKCRRSIPELNGYHCIYINLDCLFISAMYTRQVGTDQGHLSSVR